MYNEGAGKRMTNDKKVICCNRCGSKLLSYNEYSKKRYESPVKRCKKCQAYYLDSRCHEIAVEGIPSDTFSIRSRLIMGLFGAFVLYRGIHLLFRYQIGTPEHMQWLMPVVFLIMGVVLIIGAIVDVLLIMTGSKQKKYDKLRLESEARMQDKSYAYLLNELRYPGTERYL